MPHEFCLFDKMIDFKKRAQTLLGTSLKKSLAEKITSELTYGCCNSTDDKLEYVLFLFVSLSTAYAAFKENLKVKELRWFTLSWPYKPLFKKNHTQQNPNHLPYSLINNVGKIYINALVWPTEQHVGKHWLILPLQEWTWSDVLYKYTSASNSPHWWTEPLVKKWDQEMKSTLRVSTTKLPFRKQKTTARL